MNRWQLAGLSLIILGVAGLQACSNTEVTSSSESLSARAKVSGDKFALSLPDLPGMGVIGSEAHLQILKGRTNLESFLSDCSDLTKSAHVKSRRQEDQKIAAELSVPFKAGQLLGPVMLPPGGYTAKLKVFERETLAYMGVVQFSVETGIINELKLSMRPPKRCQKPDDGGVVVNPETPDGGVTINPVLPNDKKSACDFIGPITKECNFDTAFCEWRDTGAGLDKGGLVSANAKCSISAARQALISGLCEQKILVREGFLDEIYCSGVPIGLPPAVEETNKVAPFNGTIVVTLNGEEYHKQDLVDHKDAAIITVRGISGDKVIWSNSVNSKTIETILDGQGDYDNRGHYIDFGISGTSDPDLPGLSVARIGIGFEDHFDMDFNDSYVCLDGDFHVNGREITSNRDQTINATLGNISATAHLVTFTIMGSDGKELRQTSVQGRARTQLIGTTTIDFPKGSILNVGIRHQSTMHTNPHRAKFELNSCASMGSAEPPMPPEPQPEPKPVSVNPACVALEKMGKPLCTQSVAECSWQPNNPPSTSSGGLIGMITGMFFPSIFKSENSPFKVSSECGQDAARRLVVEKICNLNSNGSSMGVKWSISENFQDEIVCKQASVSIDCTKDDMIEDKEQEYAFGSSEERSFVNSLTDYVQVPAQGVSALHADQMTADVVCKLKGYSRAVSFFTDKWFNCHDNVNLTWVDAEKRFVPNSACQSNRKLRNTICRGRLNAVCEKDKSWIFKNSSASVEQNQ